MSLRTCFASLAVGLCFALLCAESGLSQLVGSQAVTSDNKLLCMAEMVSNIENRYIQWKYNHWHQLNAYDKCRFGIFQLHKTRHPGLLCCPGKPFEGVSWEVLPYRLQHCKARVASTCHLQQVCREAGFNHVVALCRALHVMMPDLGDECTSYLKSVADTFKTTNGKFEVVPTFVPATQINSEVEFMLQHNLANSHDGWIVDPMGFVRIHSFGGFKDLTQLVTTSEELAWSDVQSYVRDVAVTFKNQVVALPLDANVNLLYYR